MRKLLATATVAATLAAGSIGAAAAGATPSPSGNAYGFKAFHTVFTADIAEKTKHRGWLVVCLNGHAHPWLKSGHANAHAKAKAHGQSAAVQFSCPTR